MTASPPPPADGPRGATELAEAEKIVRDDHRQVCRWPHNDEPGQCVGDCEMICYADGEAWPCANTLVMEEYDRRAQEIEQAAYERDTALTRVAAAEAAQVRMADSLPDQGPWQEWSERDRAVRGYEGDLSDALSVEVDPLADRRIEAERQRDAYAAREEHALHVRDCALELNAASSRQVAAVRALADDLEAEADATRPDDFLRSTEPSAVASHNYDCGLAAEMEAAAKRIRIALDGSAGSPERLSVQPKDRQTPADPHLSEWQTQMRAFLGKRVEVVLNKEPRKVVVGVLHHFDTDGQVYVEDADGSWGWAWPCLDIALAGSVETPAETGGTPETVGEPINDHVADWIKATRDRYAVDTTEEDHPRAWYVLDELLDDYRLHRATGTPLDQHACEGGYCCADEPRPDPQPVNVDLLARMREGVTSREPAVCSKCGTAGCVEDAESGWYDDDLPIVDEHPMRRQIPSTDDLVSQMVARIGLGQRLLPWPELTQDLAYIATNLDAAMAGSATTTPDPAAVSELIAAALDLRTYWTDWTQERREMVRDASRFVYAACERVVDAAAALAGTAPTPGEVVLRAGNLVDGEDETLVVVDDFRLIGTWADPDFRAHQDHKHPVEGCGFCPSEEDR